MQIFACFAFFSFILEQVTVLVFRQFVLTPDVLPRGKSFDQSAFSVWSVLRPIPGKIKF